MRIYSVDEDHETEVQRINRLISTYSRRGWGVDDIQVALKRQHQISVGRNAIKCVLFRERP